MQLEHVCAWRHVVVDLVNFGRLSTLRYTALWNVSDQLLLLLFFFNCCLVSISQTGTTGALNVDEFVFNFVLKNRL
jgi:hypothetical protein